MAVAVEDGDSRPRPTGAVPDVPCPYCALSGECPYAGKPTDWCKANWPARRAERRVFEVAEFDNQSMRARGQHDNAIREAIAVWESGGQISDTLYLELRRRWLAAPAKLKPVYAWCLVSPIFDRMRAQVKAAVGYYHLPTPLGEDFVPRATLALEAALNVVNEEVVAAADGAPCRSHFERLVLDTFRWTLWSAYGGPMVQLPEEPVPFREAFELEWTRAMEFRNAQFGFLIVPMIMVPDAVRYQQLLGCDKEVSRTVCEWLAVQMNTFPNFVQHLAPKFRDVALKRHLLAMYEPMIQSAAWRAAKRARYAEGQAAEADKERIAVELRAVLAHAMDEYDLMTGKGPEVEEAVGCLGLSARPEMREQLREGLARLGFETTQLRDITPVGVTLFLERRMADHLREHYPTVPRDSAAQFSLDAIEEGGDRAGTGGEEAQGAASHVVPVSSKAWASWVQTTANVACEVDGTQYVYVDEMARLSGVSTSQLREWDRCGELPAQRLGDVDPARAGKTGRKRRVYPLTRDTYERIHQVRKARAARGGALGEGEFSRQTVANVLEVSKSTLKRWEREKTAHPQRRDGRVIYTSDEVKRLAQAKNLTISA